MKNALRTLILVTLVAALAGIANAGIIITNRNLVTNTDSTQVCTQENDKSLTGIIITNLTGIIITNLTGIIILNATDEAPVNCGIIITN